MVNDPCDMGFSINLGIFLFPPETNPFSSKVTTVEKIRFFFTLFDIR